MANFVKNNIDRQFILDSLKRDVSNDVAIEELIDNALDAALLNCKNGKLESFHISFDFEKEGGKEILAVEDNCGGFDREEAESCIFVIGGRSQRGSKKLGAFGVGLKRAIFKLSPRATVTSSGKTERQPFKVEVNQESFLAEKPYPLEFIKDELIEGCRIRMVLEKEKAEEIKKLLVENKNFKKRLGLIYSRFLSKGFKVNISGKEIKPIKVPEPSDADGNKKPFKVIEYFDNKISSGGPEKTTVRVRVGKKSKDAKFESGWFVFCNGRGIHCEDQSLDTVWGLTKNSPASSKKKVPQWHEQYEGFLGIADIICSNPREIPWSTSKNKISTEGIGRFVLQKMADFTVEWTDWTNTEKSKKTEMLFPEGWSPPQDEEKLLAVIKEGQKFKDWKKFPIAASALIRTALEHAMRYMYQSNEWEVTSEKKQDPHKNSLGKIMSDFQKKEVGDVKIKKLQDYVGGIKGKTLKFLNQAFHDSVSGPNADDVEDFMKKVRPVLNIIVGKK